MRHRYPRAHRMFARLFELDGVHQRAADGLSDAALTRIERGETPPADVRALLIARSQLLVRLQRRGRRR